MLKDYTIEDLKKDCEENELDFEQMHKIVEDWDAKKWALFFHDGGAMFIEDIDLLDIDDSPVKYDGQELLILTDDEAEEQWDEQLDSYIEWEVLSEIPEHLRFYFDDVRYKDNLKLDCRASWLASYDGDENQYRIDFDDGSSQYIYIYRVN